MIFYFKCEFKSSGCLIEPQLGGIQIDAFIIHPQVSMPTDLLWWEES